MEKETFIAHEGIRMGDVEKVGIADMAVRFLLLELIVMSQKKRN